MIVAFITGEVAYRWANMPNNNGNCVMTLLTRGTAQTRRRLSARRFQDLVCSHSPKMSKLVKNQGSVSSLLCGL